MDKKPFKNNKNSKGARKGFKHVGFVALIILIALIIFAAYGQGGGLKEISTSEAVKQANAGQFSTIVKSGNELKITKKGDKQPTLKSFVDENSTLKESGFDVSKFDASFTPASSGGSVWSGLLISILPILLIGG